MARSLAGAVHHLKRTMTQRTRTRDAVFSFFRELSLISHIRKSPEENARAGDGCASGGKRACDGRFCVLRD